MTNSYEKTLYWLIFHICLSSPLAFGAELDINTCPKAEKIRRFIEATAQIQKTSVAKEKFAQFFGPITNETSSDAELSPCWSLKALDNIDHPLRFISIYLNDRLLAGEKSNLQPWVRSEYCLSAADVTYDLEFLGEEQRLNSSTLRVRKFKRVSNAFSGIVTSELNNCLIAVELLKN